MARSPRDSDRDFPTRSGRARDKTGDAEEAARLIANSETLETFDTSIRARFGRIISSMAIRQKRSRRTKPP